MAPQRSVDRDTGMRRISTTTRWLAAVGVGCVAGLSVFFASRAPAGSGATPAVTAPATTAPATTVPPGDTRAGTATAPTAPPVTAPPMTYPPSRHTTSRGS